tara:strand:+ start:78 stop:518 length:441 start_codon:yes stop_codon:yes gene_type:complete
MRFFIYSFIFSLFLNSNAFTKDGFGEIRFTQQSFQAFLDYLRGDGDPNAIGVMMTSGTPLGFAINQKGNNTHYYYCPKKWAGNCMPGAEIDAQNKCSRRSKKKGDGRCFVFAKGRKIVWHSANVKIPKKVSPSQVREIFKENGWLD